MIGPTPPGKGEPGVKRVHDLPQSSPVSVTVPVQRRRHSVCPVSHIRSRPPNSLPERRHTHPTYLVQAPGVLLRPPPTRGGP